MLKHKLLSLGVIVLAFTLVAFSTGCGDSEEAPPPQQPQEWSPPSEQPQQPQDDGFPQQRTPAQPQDGGAESSQ